VTVPVGWLHSSVRRALFQFNFSPVNANAPIQSEQPSSVHDLLFYLEQLSLIPVKLPLIRTLIIDRRSRISLCQSIISNWVPYMPFREFFFRVHRHSSGLLEISVSTLQARQSQQGLNHHRDHSEASSVVDMIKDTLQFEATSKLSDGLYVLISTLLVIT